MKHSHAYSLCAVMLTFSLAAITGCMSNRASPAVVPPTPVNSADAGILATYELRVAGQTGAAAHSMVITRPSQVVHLELVIHITNADGNPNNDRVMMAFASVRSTEMGTLMGNFSDGKFNAALFPIGRPTSNGSAANLDANPDLEWGNTSGTSSVGCIDAISINPVPDHGDGVVFGTIDWTGPANLSRASGGVFLYVQYFRNSVSGRGWATLVSDGVQYAGATNSADANTVLAVGAGVTVVVPQLDSR